jgi:hypothetical protein
MTHLFRVFLYYSMPTILLMILRISASWAHDPFSELHQGALQVVLGVFDLKYHFLRGSVKRMPSSV